LRVVSQPASGTVAVSNNTLLVYFPGLGYAGTDTFTYAANDGWRDSALATGTVSVNAQYSLGDGIPDWWRMLYFGCVSCDEAAASADPDGDSMNNSEEFNADTDPTDNRSRLRIFALNLKNGSPVLSFESLLGKHYEVQYSENLGQTWLLLTTNVWGRTEATMVTDSSATGHTLRFYRVRAAP
jgi:hypothetical protein